MSARVLTVEDVHLTIDPEFNAILPAASKTEADDLKMLIEEDREFSAPIIFWTHGNKHLIIDGMRRFRLWQSLPDDTTIPPPPVREKTFSSREQASDWIRKHQCARRNVQAQTVALLRGRWAIQKTEALAQQPPKAPRKNKAQTAQKPPGRPRKAAKQAAKDVAKRTGVSTRTVERDVEFTKALDAIGRINSKFKADVEAGRVTVSRETITGISLLPATSIGAALMNVRFGRKWDDGISQEGEGKHHANGKANPEPAAEVSPIVEAVKALKHLSELMKSDAWADDERRKIGAELRKLANKIDPPEEGGKFKKPTVADVREYCTERGNKVDPQAFVDFYESKGWIVGKAKMKDWQAAVRTWEKDRSRTNGQHAKGINDDAFAEVFGG